MDGATVFVNGQFTDSDDDDLYALYAVDARNGTRLWTATEPPPPPSFSECSTFSGHPVASGDGAAVYVVFCGKICALDARNGTWRWCSRVTGEQESMLSEPVAGADGAAAYVATGTGGPYDGDGLGVAFEARTGTLLWD